jgi:hypothetical protein
MNDRTGLDRTDLDGQLMMTLQVRFRRDDIILSRSAAADQ